MSTEGDADKRNSIISLKVALHELSKNFESLDLSTHSLTDEEDAAIVSRKTAVTPSSISIQEESVMTSPAPDAPITPVTPQKLEVIGEDDSDSGSEDTVVDEDAVVVTEKIEKEEPKVEKKKKKKKKRSIGICTANCRYESVRRVSRRFNYKEVGENEDWVLFWTDCSVNIERVMDMRRYQKINHFPGMSEICRKDLLARNMNRMQKLFPKEYNICPRSWCLPADYSEFMGYHRTKKNKTYIIKPDNSCQGKGIMLTKTPKVDIKHCDNFVVQQYLSKPFLVDNLKFDLRIYVLVTSCDPLRIFVYRDGLVRFAVTPYQEPTVNNVDDVMMHLTNYAITKHSADFVRDDETGTKRKITHLDRWYDEHGYDKEKIWNDIEDVITKTLIVSHPTLKHNYRTCFPNHNRGSACFEILGFDIMLDRKLKPWLIEVNHSPSFHTDSQLDKDIKEAFLGDTMRMLNCSYMERKRCIEEDRRRVKERLFSKSGTRHQQSKETLESDRVFLEMMEQWELDNCGGYRRIYPKGNEHKYKQFFQQSGSLFTETVASKARQECARLQREAIQAKQAALDGKSRVKTGDSGETGESEGKRKMKKKVRPIPERLYKRPTFKMVEDAAVAVVYDTSKPIPISEEEELERLGGMIERDNLVRSLGITDLITDMLQSVRTKNSFSVRDNVPNAARGKAEVERTTKEKTQAQDKQLGGLREYPVQRQRLWQHKPSYLSTLEEASRNELNDLQEKINPSRLLNRGVTPPNYTSVSANNYLCSVYSLPRASNNVNLSVVSGPAPVSQRSDLIKNSSGTQQVEVSRTTKSTRIRGATNILRLKQLAMRENNAILS